MDRSLYEEYQKAAQGRIDLRDLDDWPVVATALLLDVPIWTEDPPEPQREQEAAACYSKHGEPATRRNACNT